MGTISRYPRYGQPQQRRPKRRRGISPCPNTEAIRPHGRSSNALERYHQELNEYRFGWRNFCPCWPIDRLVADPDGQRAQPRVGRGLAPPAPLTPAERLRVAQAAPTWVGGVS
jgi:hypothetical protein